MIIIATIIVILILAVSKIYSTGGKWVWGITLQLEECGCKHVDVVFGLFYLRWDFGKCLFFDP